MHDRLVKPEEAERLLAALFQRLSKSRPTRQQIEDIVTCLTMEKIREYMRDVGITITQTSLGMTLHISTINEDKQWIDRKVRILFDQLMEMTRGE